MDTCGTLHSYLLQAYKSYWRKNVYCDLLDDLPEMPSPSCLSSLVQQQRVLKKHQLRCSKRGGFMHHLLAKISLLTWAVLSRLSPRWAKGWWPRHVMASISPWVKFTLMIKVCTINCPKLLMKLLIGHSPLVTITKSPFAFPPWANRKNVGFARCCCWGLSSLSSPPGRVARSQSIMQN